MIDVDQYELKRPNGLYQTQMVFRNVENRSCQSDFLEKETTIFMVQFLQMVLVASTELFFVYLPHHFLAHK